MITSGKNTSSFSYCIGLKYKTKPVLVLTLFKIHLSSCMEPEPEITVAEWMQLVAGKKCMMTFTNKLRVLWIGHCLADNQST